MIFSTVFGPHEPAFTVGSLAITQTGRPPIAAMPVTTPSAPKSACSQLASSASSANEPASTRRATRSRTGSLPCCADFSRWRSGPPARARSRASLRSDTGPDDNADGSEPEVDGHRLLARVVVEAAPGLAPVEPGGHHLAQRRRRGEAPLAVLVEHDVGDRLGRVEPDEVEQRERPHRVVGAGLHRGVDLLD